MLQLGRRRYKPKFHWVVFSATGVRGEEARKAAELFAAGCEKDVVLKEFRDGYLALQRGQGKGLFSRR